MNKNQKDNHEFSHQLNYKVPKEGFIWDDDAKPVDENNSRFAMEKYLIPNPESDGFEVYNPLEDTVLFLKFSNLDTNLEDIQEFANEYGFLSSEGEFNVYSKHYSVKGNVVRYSRSKESENLPSWWEYYQDSGTFFFGNYYVEVPAETYRFLRESLISIKSGVLLWKWMENDKTELIQEYVFYQKDNSIAVKLAANEEYMKDVKDSSVENLQKNKRFKTLVISPDTESSLLQKVYEACKEEDWINAAKNYLAYYINQHLATHSHQAVLSPSNSDLEVKSKPKDLLAVFWLQLSKVLTGEVEIDWCQICGEPVDVTDKRSNWTKHNSCSSRFRQRKYYHVDKIISGEKTIKEVVEDWKESDLRNVTYEEVEEWVEEKSEKLKED